jgi:hypothetical protein
MVVRWFKSCLGDIEICLNKLRVAKRGVPRNVRCIGEWEQRLVVQGQDNVYHWDISTSDYCLNELALKRTILLSTKLSALSCRQNVTCSRHYSAKIIANFALSSNHSLVHLRENPESQLVNITQLSLYVCHTSLYASRKYCYKPWSVSQNYNHRSLSVSQNYCHRSLSISPNYYHRSLSIS